MRLGLAAMLFLVNLVCSAQTAPAAAAATAQVIFYSHGSWASQLHTFSRNGIFHGGIWQDGDPLVLFLDRPFPQNDRFVVFDLPPGTHVFGLGEGRKPRKSSLLSLDLQPGQRYFLRAHASDNYLSDTSRLELTPCLAAQADLAKSSALDRRAVQKEKLNLLSPTQTLPACPAPPTKSACNPHS